MFLRSAFNILQYTSIHLFVYVDRFMPCLKYIVENANSPELRMLRGKTIECISLIGLAVGKDKFMQDCSCIMQLLLKTQTEWQDMPEDDPQVLQCCPLTVLVYRIIPTLPQTQCCRGSVTVPYAVAYTNTVV